MYVNIFVTVSRLRLKCDGTHAENRSRLSAQRTSPFKSAGASVQSTTGRRAVHISLQGLYCSCKPVFCRHVTLTGYPLQSLVSLSPRPPYPPCLTVCHHISNTVYSTVVGSSPGITVTLLACTVSCGVGYKVNLTAEGVAATQRKEDEWGRLCHKLVRPRLYPPESTVVPLILVLGRWNTPHERMGGSRCGIEQGLTVLKVRDA